MARELGEWQEVALWDWVVFRHGERLHHPRRIDNLDVADLDWEGIGLVSCGRRGTFYIPGIVSRSTVPRCRVCCLRSGMEQGNGSPKNDERCRALVEAELNVLRGPAGGPEGGA